MKRKWPWFWTSDFGGRRPFIGTDEYWSHTLVAIWPFRGRIGRHGPVYRGLVIRLPSICRAGLREELDYLRRHDFDDF